MGRSMRQLLFLLLFVLITGYTAAAEISSKQKITVGVLSFRPISENQTHWAPLEKQLEKFAPQFDFGIISLNQTDLVNAVAKQELDFAVVHPGVLIEMETKYGVSNIASIVRQTAIDGKHLTMYGGVIAVLSSNKEIKSLSDAKGKTIAVAHRDGFASMLMQQDVFAKAGIDILKECNMVYTGQPLDNVIAAMRSKKADIGFFRTGYIEEMIANGRLSPDELTILNKQNIPNYPYLLSTPLYPEWAVVATTKANPATVKAVMASLYQIKSNDSPDYHEFGIPLSYKTTRELMQKYRVYPYDKSSFGIKEIFQKYNMEIIIFFILFATATALLAIRYFFLMQKADKQAKQLENILSTSADGIHVHDENGNLKLFSESFASMLGYTMDEMSKMTVFDWDKYFKPEKIRQTMQGMRGQLIRFETRHTRKDKSVIDVEIYARGMLINDEHLIFASSRDITSQLANKKILLAHQAMLENLAEGVYAVDTNGFCTYVNGQGCKLLGFERDEIIGKNTHRLFHGKHPDNTPYPEYDCPIYLSANSGVPFEGEEWLVKKDGTFINVHIATAPVFEDGKLISSVVSFRDITKQKELYNKLENSERSLKELNEKLEERIQEELAKNREKDMLIVKNSRLAALGELINNIAHQWRQPLNAIAIMVQDIKSSYKLEGLSEAYINKMVDTSMSQINYMSQTIDNLANFFRPECEKSYFSVRQAIKDTVEITNSAMANSNITLKSDIKEDTNIFGYENEFGQALLNILNNAKEAIVNNKIENGVISIQSQITDGKYNISIVNNGPKIDETIIDRIFDPYFTTKHSSQGTGLGLYMTKMIIEQNMGGGVDVRNLKDGVEFIISLNINN